MDVRMRHVDGVAATRRLRQLASLTVSEATVKSHVCSIFAKLGVRDRAAAIAFAYDHSETTEGPWPRTL